MSKEKEKLRWHVDYLPQLCEPIGTMIFEKGEKEIAKKLSKLEYVKGFSSTDDTKNPSHLFRFHEIRELMSIILS